MTGVKVHFWHKHHFNVHPLVMEIAVPIPRTGESVYTEFPAGLPGGVSLRGSFIVDSVTYVCAENYMNISICVVDPHKEGQ